MKEIKRNIYLNALIDRKENEMIKIITGIRRCGKSYLMDPIFKNYLLSEGIKEDHIIKLELDAVENEKYRDAHKLYDFVMSKIKDNNMYYILLDEIQLVENFESVLNSFLRKRNLDVYVTYGGMPYILSRKTEEQKVKYLDNLFKNTYTNDIVERNNIQRRDILDSIINMLASSIGSLTNPMKISNTFMSKGFGKISNITINKYIEYLCDAFMIRKAERYDIKGKKYISTPSKYYFTDVGLRNARINFRQQEEDHLMENIIYNELLVRGYNVDVGNVEHFEKDKNEKTIRKQLEVDFVCNQGNKRYYIQSAFAIPNKEKMEQEQKSLINIKDSFKKIIIVKDDIKLWRNENGITIMSLEEFLLNPNSLDL